jgi:hypothetical protein
LIGFELALGWHGSVDLPLIRGRLIGLIRGWFGGGGLWAGAPLVLKLFRRLGILRGFGFLALAFRITVGT